MAAPGAGPLTRSTRPPVLGAEVSQARRKREDPGRWNTTTSSWAAVRAGAVLAARLSRGSGPPRPAARGRAGLRDARADAGTTCSDALADVVARPRLAAYRRGRARPGDPLSARPRDRRLLGRQRHDCPARRAGRLRRVGGARQRCLGLGEACCRTFVGWRTTRRATTSCTAAAARSRSAAGAETS